MEKIKGGYILQPRCFDSSEAAHFPPCTREVWFFILRNVNHADNGKFKRGSAFFNFADIQNALAWTVGYRIEKYSKPQLTKAMRRLCEGNMIETAKATRGLFVTVLNYDKYQNPSLYEGNGEGNAKEMRRKCEGEHLKQEERTKEEEIKDSCSGPKKNGTEHFLPEHHSMPDKIPYSQIIRALNSTCGCDYKPNTISTRQHIKARWNEGWRMEDFEAVIVGMRSKWANDPKMCQYLRPQTLFGTKFESYLQVVKNGSTTTTSGDIKCNHCRYRASDVCSGKSDQQRISCGSFCKEEVTA